MSGNKNNQRNKAMNGLSNENYSPNIRKQGGPYDHSNDHLLWDDNQNLGGYGHQGLAKPQYN
jgi:hypothetical protein